jgi:hypothetical protein
MTKFNTTDRRRVTATGPIITAGTPAAVNHQGGVGYERSPTGELFLLATTSFDLTADTFYEGGDDRVTRFVDLVRTVTAADPDWMFRFLTWLRTKGNIRTAAVVGGVEACVTMAKAKVPGGRHMIATVLRRADEPGEAIAYFHARHGRNLPKPLKRGIGDAVTRLYNERSLLKYDTASHGIRFADVLALTHPGAGPQWQRDLFAYAVDRRYGRDDAPASLFTIRANAALRAQWESDDDTFDLDPQRLTAAGMTWEDALSAVGGKVVDKADLWRNLIPTMGFMALLRNLRNFDEAGLTDADVAPVTAMLADPEQVRASKQLPLRFLSAYRHTNNLRWRYPLELAINTAVENIPAVPGRTLILIDTSGSMNIPMSDRHGRAADNPLLRWDAAVAFGLALARRCDTADVVSYSAGAVWYNHNYAASMVFPTNPAESLLLAIDRWQRDGYFIGGGTDTVGALRRHYRDHDRVVLLTDEQDGGFGTGEVSTAIPADRPLTTFNLAGYRQAHAPSGPNRVTIGGLTDAMFPLITQLEQGHPGGWPWSADPSVGPLPTYPQAAGEVTR